MIQWDSCINTYQRFGYNFQRQNVRNLWRARGDGHRYDITSKSCGVIITTVLVEWTLTFSEIIVVFYYFDEFKASNKIKQNYTYKVWDKRKTTWTVGNALLNPENPSTFGLGSFVPTANLVVS